jgi:hypothetical protein
MTVRLSSLKRQRFLVLISIKALVDARATVRLGGGISGLSPGAKLYRWSNRAVREVSANFCGQRLSRGQRNGSPLPYSRISIPQQLNCIHEAEWTPFQTHYFSEKVVAPGIEPGPVDL